MIACSPSLNDEGRVNRPPPPSPSSPPPPTTTTSTLQLDHPTSSSSSSSSPDRPLRPLPSRFGSPASNPTTSPSSRMATLSLGPSNLDGTSSNLFGSSSGGYIDLRMGEFEGTTRYDGHDEEGFEGEMGTGGGGGGEAWDDGFHPTTTSLPKK
ncbi:hypothetical protein BDY24DRAFT_271260 [Mrakia frigida]|uniref:uncharacterized protein n=1 Tax=Mrakia frigida TaxID=29902 RepID=UPI003FCC25CC